MDIVFKKKEYILQDVMVECDCSCCFLRFTIFENTPDAVYFHYYGQPLQSPTGIQETLSFIALRELGKFLTSGGKKGDISLCGHLIVARDQDIPVFNFDLHDNKDRTVYSLCLAEAQAEELGTLFLNWTRGLEEDEEIIV